MNRYYINGVEVSRDSAIELIEAGAFMQGYALMDDIGNIDAMEQDEEGRDILVAFTDYMLEIVAPQ
jgi:hypothetical protein